MVNKILSENTVKQHLALYEYWFQYKNYEIFLISSNQEVVNKAVEELAKIPKIITILIQDRQHTLNFDMKDIISIVRDNVGVIKEINISNGDKLVCIEIDGEFVIYDYVN